MSFVCLFAGLFIFLFCFSLSHTLLSGGKRKVLAVPGEVINDADHPPIPVDQFAKHVAKLHKSDDRGYMIEYNVMDLV